MNPPEVVNTYPHPTKKNIIVVITKDGRIFEYNMDRETSLQVSKCPIGG